MAARWMTCEQPRMALRASSSERRSPVCTSQPSRIQAGAARWSETRTSNSGSRSRRRTTAAPRVPAPPVTRTRVMRARRLPAHREALGHRLALHPRGALAAEVDARVDAVLGAALVGHPDARLVRFVAVDALVPAAVNEEDDLDHPRLQAVAALF